MPAADLAMQRNVPIRLIWMIHSNAEREMLDRAVFLSNGWRS
jgi:hypothetical protein